MEANIQMRAIVSGTLTNATGTTPLQEHRSITIYRAAINDQGIANALEYFSRGDWINLYKTYEIIRVRFI
jgi:uncharacterized protein YjlB